MRVDALLVSLATLVAALGAAPIGPAAPSTAAPTPSVRTAGRPTARPMPATSQVYLPLVTAPAALERCASLSPARCAMSDAGGWRAVCGGFGAVRDLGTVGSEIVAVGDGVARYDPEADRWSAQLGVELTGLNALHLDRLSGVGWAVGARDRTAYHDQRGCWWSDYTGTTHVELTAVRLLPEQPGHGWAVGTQQRATDGRTGALRVLRPTDSRRSTWFDAGGARLPPLSDLTLWTSPQGLERGWAVGGDEAGGVFVSARAWPDGQVDWHVAARVPRARPQALAMLDGGTDGWAFGALTTEPRADTAAAADEPALATWRYDPPGAKDPGGLGRWIERPDLRVPGRTLVDVERTTLAGQPSLLVGVSPGEPGAALLRRLTREADGGWQWRGHGAPALPSTSGGGSRAVAALDDGGLLYAWGDEIWRHRPDRGWRRSRTRRQLIDFVPTDDGSADHRSTHNGSAIRGWALERSDSGTRLLALERDGLRVVHERLPTLDALDGTDGRLWAVGRGGASWHKPAPHARWQPADAVPDATLVDVSVTAAGVAWAVGTDRRAGRNRIWRHVADHGWWVAAETDRRLRALSANDDGRVLAVGDGVSLSVDARCAPTATDRCDVRETALPYRTTLHMVAHRGADAALAADRYHVFGYRDGDGWQLLPAEAQPPLVAGSWLIALGAASKDAVWAVHQAGPADHPWSAVLCFDGTAWRRSTVVNSAVAALHAGADRLWLAGDWSTLVRRDASTSCGRSDADATGREAPAVAPRPTAGDGL